MAHGLNGLARIVEPVDRALGEDPNRPAARAFAAGAIMGLRVVSECVDNVDKAFANIALMPSTGGFDTETEDRLALRHQYAAEVVNIGDMGYAQVDTTFNPLFEEWIDDIEREVPYQRYVKSGFGIPVVYLLNRQEQNQEADQLAFAAQVDAMGSGEEIDWDQLLQ